MIHITSRYFESAMSVGPLTDTVVSINLPMVGAVNYVRENSILEYVISDILQTIEVSFTNLVLSMMTSRPRSLSTRQLEN